jgi:hypothetical protein
MPQPTVSKLRASAAGQRRKIFEISLVRAAMDAMEDGRQTCEHCGRTPLVGETVFVSGDRTVCELCRRGHRDGAGHEEVVHSIERDHTVKRRFAA